MVTRPPSRRSSPARSSAAVPFVLAAAALGGCGDGEDAVRAREEIGEAAGATADYLENRRQEFLTGAEQRLESLADELGPWSEKAAAAKGAAKEELDATVARLKEELARSEERLADFKARNAEAFDALSKGVDDALTDLKASFGAAKERFRGE